MLKENQKKKKPSFFRFCCQNGSSDEEKNEVNDQSSLVPPSSLSMQYSQPPALDTIKKSNLTLKGSDGNFLAVHLTQKNFFVDFEQRKHKFQDPRRNIGSILFSKFQNGIKLEEEEYRLALPEKVLLYMIDRLNGHKINIVLDPQCRSGGALVRFASKYFTIGLDRNPKYLLNSRFNSSIYDVTSNINFIQGTIGSLRRFEVDLVYMHPNYLISPNKFDMYKDITNIVQLISQSIRFAKNLILVLPRFCQLNQIANVIAFVFKRIRIDIHKIEIQQIQVDGQLMNYVVYIGEISSANSLNEYEFLAQLITSDTDQQKYYLPVYQLLQKIKNQVTFQQLLDLIVEESENSTPDLLLSVCIAKLLKEHIIEVDDISGILSEQLHVANSPRFKNMSLSQKNLEKHRSLNGQSMGKFKLNSDLKDDTFAQQKNNEFSFRKNVESIEQIDFLNSVDFANQK